MFPTQEEPDQGPRFVVPMLGSWLDEYEKKEDMDDFGWADGGYNQRKRKLMKIQRRMSPKL